MPIYEYACQGCQKSFELLIRGDEQPTCPTCAGTKLEKQFSVPAAHVAGGSRDLPMAGGGGFTPCGMGGCGRPECE